MKKIASYLRVSTVQQDEKLQRDALQAWLSSRSLSADWYVDHGESSEALSRPGLDALMAALRRGEYDTLLVWKLDRIGRWSADDYILFRIEMNRLGVSVVSVTEGESSFTGMVDKIIALVDAHAREKWMQDHRDRCRAAWKTHRASYEKAKKESRRCDWGEVERLLKDGWPKKRIAEKVGISPSGVLRIERRLKLIASSPQLPAAPQGR